MPRIQLVKVGHRTSRQKFAQPLGIMYLAAYIRRYVPESEVRLLDMLPENLSLKDIAEKVLQFKPDIIGISAMTYEREELHKLTEILKSCLSKTPIIVGGPYPTTAGELVLKDEHIDFIVRGEGEITFLELINYLFPKGQSKKIEEIDGLGYRMNGRVVINKPREFIQDLDSLPFPAWDLIDMKRYWDIPRFGTTYVHKEYMSVFTSRGCPFRCTYCHRVFGRSFRPRSPENVIEELKILYHQYGIREIHFIDDCFNFQKERAERICELIVESGLKFSINFPNGIRGDIMDEELLESLKKAGTYRITYAVEAGSPRVQKFMKKNLNLKKVEEMIKLTDKKQIMVDGFFMVGFPGEKKEEIEQTLGFALRSRLHSLNIFYVTPFEGTELYEQASSLGLKPSLARVDGYTYFFADTNLSEVPTDELKRMVKRTFIRFYLNPWRLWRVLRLFPNKLQLPYLLWLFIKYSFKWV